MVCPFTCTVPPQASLTVHLVSILLINGIAILSEDRFLARSKDFYHVMVLYGQLTMRSWLGKHTDRASIRGCTGYDERQGQDHQLDRIGADVNEK